MMDTRTKYICESCGNICSSSGTGHCDVCGQELIDSDNYLNPNLEWGTLGKDGKGPLTYVKLKECSNDHLKNILETQGHLPKRYLLTIRELLVKSEVSTLKKTKLEDLPLTINEELLTDEARDFIKKRLLLGV